MSLQIVIVAFISHKFIKKIDSSKIVGVIVIILGIIIKLRDHIFYNQSSETSLTGTMYVTIAVICRSLQLTIEE